MNSGYLNAVFRRFLLNYIVHNESLKCERLKSQKIRRRPESCHGFHPEVSFYFFIIIIFVSSRSCIPFKKRQIEKLSYNMKLIRKYLEYSEHFTKGSKWHCKRRKNFQYSCRQCFVLLLLQTVLCHVIECGRHEHRLVARNMAANFA